MSTLAKLTPLNVQEEKTKFFADQSYNPQFVYPEPVDQSNLNRYGVPHSRYLDAAHEIIDRAYHHQSETDLLALEGPTVSQEKVTEQTQRFLKLHNLENRYSIIWSSTFVSRASITENTVKFRVGAEFRTENLLGLLYHEIGTHGLRRINYEQQPWFKKKKKFGFAEHLITEEGLASLHSLLPKTQVSAHTFALRYLAVDYSQHHSFAELWQFLTPYIDNLDTRWMVAIRQKRGVSDTSQAGGFTKDIAYFQGLIEVWHWLNQHKFNIKPLYFGKLAIEDVSKARDMNPTFEPILPVFFRNYESEYAESISAIGIYNQLDKLVNV
jgi:hypothetical protein